MDIKKILWPTDFSEYAAKALPMVISIAEKYDAEVLAVHVTEPLNRYEVLADVLSPKQLEDTQRALESRSFKQMESTCGDMVNQCRQFERRVVAGDPVEEILKVIDTEKVDMVIMATQGRTGLARWAFGSVTEEVFRSSPVPVLSIRAK